MVGNLAFGQICANFNQGHFDSKFKNHSGLQVAFITFYILPAHTLSYHYTFQNIYLWLVDFLVHFLARAKARAYEVLFYLLSSSNFHQILAIYHR